MSRRLTGALVLLGVLLAVTACGKKGPPKAPRQKPLPVIDNLAYRLEGEQLLLSWSYPAEEPAGVSEPEGFAVYRARQVSGPAACKECPPAFEQIAEVVSTPAATEQTHWRFHDTLDEGFIYRYKVKAMGRRGAMGQDSNQVQVVF